MKNFIAQNPQNIGGPITGIGNYGTSANWQVNFSRILTVIVGLLTVIAGIYFIFLLISGGIAWMASGGDKGKLAAARSTMVSGAIGLAIVVAALFIAEILGGLLNINILDPSSILDTLGPN